MNQESLEPPALIYGTPSFALPYDPAARPAYATFPAYAKYALSPKWNGVNVSVFKYPGPGAQTFVSAKPRFYPFLSEATPASLGHQVKRILGGVATLSLDKLPPLLAPLAKRKGMPPPRVCWAAPHASHCNACTGRAYGRPTQWRHRRASDGARPQCSR